MKSKCCNASCCVKLSVVIGGVLVIFGGVLMVVFDAIYETAIKKQTSVTPGTLVHRLIWADVQIPVYRSFYIFNLTNKDEFLGQRSGNYVKPVLQEIGPYTYKEYLVKENITYLDYNSSHHEEVHFTQTATFFFDAERSVGSVDDSIVTINFLVPLIAGVLEHVFEPGPVLDAGFAALNQIIQNTDTELVFTKSVGEYLFGFEDPFLSKILDWLVPDRENQEFGLFMLTNITAGWPEYQVYTGRENYLLNNVITKFNGKSDLQCWFGESCNTINGTDGTFTHPFMKKNDPVYIFVDEMRRSIYSRYERESSVNGIRTWRYTIPGAIFQSPINNTDNQCFCKDAEHMLCRHDGALLGSSCLYNAPLVFSLPHFLHGDGYYVSKLEGLKPSKEKHEIAIDYEPATGLVMNASMKMQLGLYMFPHPQVRLLQQIDEEFVYPLIWLDEQAVIPDDIAGRLYILLYQAEDLFLLLQIVLIIVGSIMLILSAAYFVRNFYKRRNKSHRFEDKDLSVKMESMRCNSVCEDVINDVISGSENSASHQRHRTASTPEPVE